MTALSLLQLLPPSTCPFTFYLNKASVSSWQHTSKVLHAKMACRVCQLDLQSFTLWLLSQGSQCRRNHLAMEVAQIAGA